MASYLDASAGGRVLCGFGLDRKRSDAARRSVDEFASAVRSGAFGLRCVATEQVSETGDKDGLLLLLLAPAAEA
eukprot:140928-Prymnesium_polylepis.1